MLLTQKRTRREKASFIAATFLSTCDTVQKNVVLAIPKGHEGDKTLKVAEQDDKEWPGPWMPEAADPPTTSYMALNTGI